MKNREGYNIGRFDGGVAHTRQRRRFGGNQMRGRRIGFVSTRLKGTDGVTLETRKWSEVLERNGHTCFYLAGASDMPAERTRLVTEALFTNSDIQATYRASFSRRTLHPDLPIAFTSSPNT